MGEASPAGEKQDLCAKPSVVKRALCVSGQVCLAKALVDHGEQNQPVESDEPWKASPDPVLAQQGVRD